jgi:hypothetical protein
MIDAAKRASARRNHRRNTVLRLRPAGPQGQAAGSDFVEGSPIC